LASSRQLSNPQAPNNSIPGPSRCTNRPAYVVSPSRSGPNTAPINALVPHSTNTTSRNNGYPNSARAPERLPYPAPVNADASGTRNVAPSTATTRNRRQNTPGIPTAATGPATASNNARNGAGPTRRRANTNPDTHGQAANGPNPATNLPHTCR
jgi:hypothetical protein